jgi:glucose/mannose-6-phosphate isomerase
MHTLDDPATFALDQHGMLGHVAAVGTELTRAWRASAELELPSGARSATALVLAGIGGSATAGDYFAALCAPSARIPVIVVRGPELPAFVGPRTLVVACSYSGNTEETLAAYGAARVRGAGILAISRGGRLAEACGADGVPLSRITYDAPPRATTVQTLAPLLRLGSLLNLTAVNDDLIELAAAAHGAAMTNALGPSVPAARNEAKQLAAALEGRLPLIIGARHLAPAATRFKNQLAENGKTLAAADVLPEAGHNLVVGLATADRLADRLAVVTLEGEAEGPMAQRFATVAAMFAERGVPVHRIAIPAGAPLDQLLVATAWGDTVSCYLGLLGGEDPTPIPQIDRFRAALAG